MARSRPNERRHRKRNELWPDSEGQIFDPDAPRTVGYARVPRTVPLLARLADDLDSKINCGSLYMSLWFRDYGQGFVEIENPSHLLFEAGFTSVKSRGERSWIERTDILAKFGFIRAMEKSFIKNGYIMLVNPQIVVSNLESINFFHSEERKAWLAYFRERSSETGIDE